MTQTNNNNATAVSASPYANYSAPQKQLIDFDRNEGVIALLMLVAGFFFARYVFANNLGFFTSFFFILLMAVDLVFLSKKGYKLSYYHLTLVGIYFAFSAAFSLTGNNFVKSLDAVFLMLLGAYTIFAICNERNKTGKFFAFDMLKSVFGVPLSGFGYAPRAIKSGKGKGAKNVWFAVLGVAIAVPLLFVVIGLLSEADAGFEQALSDFFKNIRLNKIIVIVFEILIGIPVAFYLFGLVFSNTRGLKSFYLTDDYNEMKTRKLRFAPSVTIYAAATPLILVYAAFIVIQLNYFFSAFNGVLPKGFSYSEYARRGFFELFAIALINLAVIILMTVFSKWKDDNEKPVVLKVYTTVLSVLTLFIIATAFSKMMLYISDLGLTRKRVNTSWFMILLTFLFIAIIIKQFAKRFSVSTVMGIVFTMMFAFLCFGSVDELIATYNIQMYKASEYTQKLDVAALVQLSDDGWITMLENKDLPEIKNYELGNAVEFDEENNIYYQFGDECIDNENDGRAYGGTFKEICQQKYEYLQMSKFNRCNASSIKLKLLLEQVIK